MNPRIVQTAKDWGLAMLVACGIVGAVLLVTALIYTVAADQATDINDDGIVEIDGCMNAEACTVEYDEDERVLVITKN